MKKSLFCKKNFKHFAFCFILFLSNQLFSQGSCQASFTYTLGANGQVSLASNSTGTTVNTNYNWAWDGDNSNEEGNNITTTSQTFYNGPHSIRLTISESSTNCSSTFSDSIYVTSGLPCPLQPSFTYVIDTLNADVTFTYTSTSGGLTGGNPFYVFNSGYSSYNFYTSGTLTLGYPYNGTYITSLTMTGYGCSNTFIDTLKINIPNHYNCNLAVGFTYSVNNNGVVSFTNTSTGIVPGLISYWQFGDGNAVDTIASTPTLNYTYLANGTYSVSLFITDSNSTCKDSTYQIITVSNVGTCNPTTIFSIVPDTSQAHTWFVLPSYSSQINNAIWYWGDGTSTQGLYPSHTYSVAGKYNICVTVFSSCGDSAQACQNDSVYRYSNNSTNSNMISVDVVNSTTGINQLSSNNNQLTIYPNPAQNNFTIETSSTEKQILNIFDVNGKLVLQQNIQGKITIDASNLNAGVYNININGTVNKKLVIVK